LSGEEPLTEYERVVGLIAGFVKQRTKAELFSAALERGLLIAPITTLQEVLSSEQLESRGYWQQVEHPELKMSFPYPGPFARFSETPVSYSRRPPLVGEHNREVYVGEMGLSEHEFADFARRGII
jgi:formyl-CoA transferase